MEYELLLVILFNSVLIISVSSRMTSWITVSKELQNDQEENPKEEFNRKIPKISSMSVVTNVTNRFSTTLVTSRVKNADDKAQEVTFSVILPETAYISGFIMEIDGKQYKAYVQEKEEAKRTYDNAVASGNAAGHVALNARDSNRFTVSVNIEPQSKATFYLNYEELLKRESGQYEIVINLHPGQPIDDLNVQVNINESRPLTFVIAPSMRSGNEISKNEEKLDPRAQIEFIGKQSAKIVFKPDVWRQKELARNMGTKESEGLAGQFVVNYDVQRDPFGGEILVSDGYFVHFFAPSDLEPLPKQVIFVLDTSISMHGTRLRQLKEAMKSILKQLKMNDTFNIIDFNSKVKVWNIPKVQYEIHVTDSSNLLPSSFEVSNDSIKKAEKVIEQLDATDGTNIASALSIALKLIAENKSQDERQPIIMFLTDGEPSVGLVNCDEIVSKITKENKYGVPLFSLSFGLGANRTFLEKLSLKNQGFARHIYEGADASLQLESFYKYISSLLLKKVHFEYVSNSTSGITRTHFPIFFEGSELVVAGRHSTSRSQPGLESELSPIANCLRFGITKVLKPIFVNPIGSLEKHWAYLTLKQILEDRDGVENKTELTKKALDIALQYSFVTAVTSLVVVKPNNTKDETNPEDASKSKNNMYNSFSSGYRLQSSRIPIAPRPRKYRIRPKSYDLGSTRGRFDIRLGSPYITNSSFQPEHYDSSNLVPEYISQISQTTSTTESSTNNFAKLKKSLPWIENALSTGNNTLKLQQGEFIIDTPTKIIDEPQCTNAPLNRNGTCVLLRECPQIYGVLLDLQTYIKYFCALNEWAGVCCPSETKN